MHEEVVGRHAGLSRVDAFPPSNSLCGSFDVGVRGYNAGTLPAQLVCDIGQIFCGSMHNLSANGWASSEEDFVEMDT